MNAVSEVMVFFSRYDVLLVTDYVTCFSGQG